MSSPNFPLQQISRWDAELCAFCNRRSRSFTVRQFFRIISRLGDGLFWYAMMSILLLRHQADAALPVLHMLFVAFVGTIIYTFIKEKTLRPRPFNVHPAIICFGKTLDQFSFPSGHTMHATAFSIIAVFYFPAIFWLVVPFAVLVALSRPILGLHYPSDVLAGAVLGALLALPSLYLL